MKPRYIVLGATAAMVGIPVANHYLDKLDERPSTPDPKVSCAYTPDAVVNAAQYALDIEEGDSVQAIVRARRLVRDYYSGQCDEAMVTKAQSAASRWIAKNHDSYEPKILPTEIDPSSEVRIVGIVNCEDVPTGDREIRYPYGVAPKASNIPFGLWEHQRCEIEPGEVDRVLISRTEIIEVQGR